jgi:hypothetical protein
MIVLIKGSSPVCIKYEHWGDKDYIIIELEETKHKESTKSIYHNKGCILHWGDS